MKTRFLLLVAIIGLFGLALTACQSPAPLPVAPTPIQTLIPATLPPPGEPTPIPGMEAVAFPISAPSQAAGQAVYEANCASCHGADGVGVVENARDFNDVDYMRAAAPVAFYQSITNGKETMPAFGDSLSDGDRWNVTYYLWHWSVPQAMLDQGQPVYEANCVACHGPDGQGAIPQAAKFSPEFISKSPPSQYYESVSGGKGIMPAWQDRLSEEERWAAIEYSRAFAYEPLGQ
jgi:cytochrome c oxidase cbb3-type subunit 3